MNDPEQPQSSLLQDFEINQLGEAVCAAVAQFTGNTVSLVMFIVDDETGVVTGTSTFAPEQLGEFLDFVRAQHRSGEFTVEKPTETKQ